MNLPEQLREDFPHIFTSKILDRKYFHQMDFEFYTRIYVNPSCIFTDAFFIPYDTRKLIKWLEEYLEKTHFKIYYIGDITIFQAP